MKEEETIKYPRNGEQKERINKAVPVVFFKLGGTWDMVEKEGRLIGTGNLDDDELYRIEEKLGLHTALSSDSVHIGERELARELYERFQNTKPEIQSVGEIVESWCPDFKKAADGPFIPLFSGDSSHYRPSIIAPATMILLDQAKNDPQKPIIGGMGTDTADVAVLAIIDVLVFDTELPPFLLAGANRSHRERNSDAPHNFRDLALLSRIDIRGALKEVSNKDVEFLPTTGWGSRLWHAEKMGSGAFWVFADNLYMASDLIKIDPAETRQTIEGQSTFFSPNKTNQKIGLITQRDEYGNMFETDWSNCKAPSPDHVIQQVTLERLFDALNSTHIIDLGDQNKIWEQVAQILDPANRVVIIEAHSLGNANNIIRAACIEAAKTGKLIIDTSRCLVGEVNTRYAGSLLDANTTEGQLAGTGSMILSSNKLNKTAARAIGMRAVLEGLDQQQTQELINLYCESRNLL